MMDSQGKKITVWQIILLVEIIVLLISLAMTFGPSKTGSDWHPAQLFFENPNYWQIILIYFIFTNILIGILALIAAIYFWWEKKKNEEA
jgi:hypothetical protein